MTDGDYWRLIFEEIKRKHEHNYSRWTALDAKVGVVLGFAVVVLFQLLLSSDINSLIGIHQATVNHMLLDYLAFAFFVGAILSLVAVCGAGFWAFRLVSFKEIPLAQWIEACMDGTMKIEAFSGKVAWHLYNYYPYNERQVLRKTEGFKVAFMLFLAGVALFLARFIVMLISNSVA